MSDVGSIKSELLESLWLPTIRKGASLLHPRLRKNKRMKLLTLTNEDNYSEISRLIAERITEKQLVHLWNHSNFKRIRLGAEGWDNVGGMGRYEESIVGGSPSIAMNFPFDILNLDFLSQDPVTDVGRFEREVLSLEKTLFYQGNKPGYVIIFTTLVNGARVNCAELEDSLDLQSQYPPPEQGISDCHEKIEFLQSVIPQIVHNHGYQLEITASNHELTRDLRYACSFGCILRETVPL